MALRLAHLRRLAVAPHRALAQQPVRGEPCAREQQRGPPRVGGEHDRRGETAHQLHQPGGDEIHRDEQRRAGDAEIEIPGHREVADEPGVLEVAHAGRADAGSREAVVQPRRGAAPEIGADGVVNRREHLQQDEHDADEPERRRQVVTPLDRSHQAPHRDGEQCGQRPAQHEERPPRDGQRAVGLWQHARERPLLTRAQPLDHQSRSPASLLGSGARVPHSIPPCGSV